MNLQIRPMTAEDHPRALEIARGLAAWFQPLDQMALAIDLRGHPGLVAEQGGRVIGFLTFLQFEPEEVELTWLAVAPEVQAQGIGSRLLQWLEREMRSRGATRIYVNTIPADHDPAFVVTNEFYRRHGFEVARRDDNFYAHGRPGIRLEKKWGTPSTDE